MTRHAPTTAGSPARARPREAGSTLLLALLILATLSILATTAIVTSMNDRNLARFDRDSVQALGAAETGVAFAKRAIIDQTAPMGDSNGNGKPDFQLSDSLSWGGTYQVFAEASDIKGVGITAYQSNGFTIVAQGNYRGASRRVKVTIVHDSFLKFARFVSGSDLSYACDALISGEVYAGNNVVVACGCGNGHQDHFLENVFAVNDVPSPTCGVFDKGYVTHSDTIDISNSFNWTDIRNKAKGLGADNSCEHRGSIGIYINLPGTDPLGLHAQTTPTHIQDVLWLNKFDFDTDVVGADTLIKYGSNTINNPVTGHPLKRSEFNGIVFFEGAGNVKGTSDGVSGRNLTLYCTTTCTVRGDIVTGHTGFNSTTHLPNGTGNPINLALVADSYIAMADTTCKVLRVDAAIFSRTSNWRGLGSTTTHPTDLVNPGDLDLDGLVGETPVNNDPTAGVGWDEAHINGNTWVINLTGPIITAQTGDAQPWNTIAGAGPTRRYNYDLDITDYPPPCFPVPLNLWKDVSWTEIWDLSGSLASDIP